jgi:hypothetical protein
MDEMLRSCVTFIYTRMMNDGKKTDIRLKEISECLERMNDCNGLRQIHLCQRLAEGELKRTKAA